MAIIVILGIGEGRVALGELAVPTLVAFLLHVFNIVDPIIVLAGAFAFLQSGLVAAARIRDIEHLEAGDTHILPIATASPIPEPDTRFLYSGT